jgi:hypothetical protein
MHEYKRNQVEEAIFRTLGAREARIDELKFRIKRLLVTDRRLGRNADADEKADRCYAFFSQEPPGSGIEVKFSGYEAFALLAAILLLEHGLPQASVVRVIRQVRTKLEAGHARILRMDQSKLFDFEAVQEQAKPGMMATNTTQPVFLAFVRLTGSLVDDQKRVVSAEVCEGHDQLNAFWRKYSEPGFGMTVFEFAGLMHTIAANLSQARAIARA